MRLGAALGATVVSRVGALAAAAFLPLAFALTWRLWTPNLADRRWIQPGDFSDQFYPWARFLSDELNARRLPLWNPYIFGGYPFHADPQAAVFYPVQLLVALLLGRGGLGYRELELELPLHFALGAIGMYAFAGRISGSRLGGAVAAIAFGFGGFLTSYPAQQLAMLRTAAWLPLYLYCLDRALEGRRWLIAAGGVLAVIVLAGHTQTAMFALYLGVAYALWRGDSWRERLIAAAVPPALAAGLAAVQLLPTLEFVGVSTRDQLPYDSAAYGYELKALPGVLLPGWRGERALYLGIAPLALAALALANRSRAALFWGVCAGLALMVSVGGRTFLFPVLYLAAPGWGTFRDQERAAAIWSCAVAVLAAYGVVALHQRAGGGLHCAVLMGLAASLLLTVQVLVLWTGRRADEVNPYDALFESAVLLSLLLLLLALVLRARRALAPLLLGLLVFDLFSVNGGNNLSAVDPAATLARESALELPRREAEPYRLRSDDDKRMPPNLAMVWRAPFMSGDSPIQLRRAHDLLSSREEWRLWQLFNTKYLLSWAERKDPGLEQVGAANDLRVYRVTHSLPRAWAVSDVRVVPEREARLDLLFSRDVHPGDLAIVEEAPPLAIAPGLPRPEVQVRSTWPNGMEIAVRSTGNALLVVADGWHPGWRAEVDGAPTPILRTNHAFRGVAVGPGEHTVVMRYRPTSLFVGAALSVLTALAAVAALVILRRPGG